MEERSKIEQQNHYFFKAINPVIKTLPDLIQEEISTLNHHYKNYLKLVKSVTEPRDSRKEMKQEWFIEGYQTIKKCFDYLNFIDREFTDIYFQGKLPSQMKSAPKTYQMIVNLIKITRQPNHRELDHYINELNHLYLQGNELFSPVASAASKRREINRLKKLYQQKYKTVWYYLKAFYNESKVNFHTFFLE